MDRMTEGADELAAQRKEAERPNVRRPSAGKRPQTSSDTKELGNALRSIYDETVSEDIPTELLDLLGKLR